LFFLNPSAFDRHLARLKESRAPVERTDGCIVTKSSVRDVLARDDRAPIMSHGSTLEEWHGMHAEWLDVAGGSTCYRLRYLKSPEDLHAPGKQLSGSPRELIPFHCNLLRPRGHAVRFAAAGRRELKSAGVTFRQLARFGLPTRE
jgi:hypothetical protein